MLKLEDGIHDGISNDAYHGDRKYLSSSSLKTMYNNPRSFYAQYIEGEQSFISPALQAAFDFGSYFHTLVLEPHLIGEEYSIDVEIVGKTTITEDQQKMASKMYKKYMEASIVLGKQGSEQEVKLSSFIEGGMAEQTLCTTLNGIGVKVRPDYRREFASHGEIVDVKTTSEKSLTPYKVEKICAKYGYDLSAALYVDVVQSLTGLEQDFYFLFCSKASSQTVLFKASEGMLERGRVAYIEALRLIKEARETGVYYNNIVPLLK